MYVEKVHSLVVDSHELLMLKNNLNKKKTKTFDNENKLGDFFRQ